MLMGLKMGKRLFWSGGMSNAPEPKLSVMRRGK